jgi:NAD(P)-dependent dehydrogenase (short-subunit alcohol dehydrogenase family)
LGHFYLTKLLLKNFFENKDFESRVINVSSNFHAFLYTKPYIDIENFKNDCSKTHSVFNLYCRSKAANSNTYFFFLNLNLNFKFFFF